MSCSFCGAAMHYAENDGYAEWTCSQQSCMGYATIPLVWMTELGEGIRRLNAAGRRACEACGTLLPESKRPYARFHCGPNCRKIAMRRRRVGSRRD